MFKDLELKERQKCSMNNYFNYRWHWIAGNVILSYSAEHNPESNNIFRDEMKQEKCKNLME